MPSVTSAVVCHHVLYGAGQLGPYEQYNTLVFFLRDPLKFPNLNHVVKRDPCTNMRNAKNNWDFWTLLPEALHHVTIVISDRSISTTYRPCMVSATTPSA